MKKVLAAALLPLSLLASYACSSAAIDPGPAPEPSPEAPAATVPSASTPTPTPTPTPEGGAAADSGTAADTGAGDAATASANPVDGFVPTRIASGAGYVDGIQWRGNALFFTVNDNATDTLVKLTLPDTPSEFRKPAGRALGLALDVTKGLLLLESSPVGRLVKVSDDGLTVTPVASSATQDDAGARDFDSPNDIVVRKDGVMFVTDPGYQARVAGVAVLNRIYRITPTGTATTEATFPGGDQPNGVALSPDERTLYVSFTAPSAALSSVPFVAKYAVAADGRLSGRASFTSFGVASVIDGLTTDDAGNVYVATDMGVDVFSPAGVKVGAVPVPAADRPVHAVRFGGADRKSLYIGFTGGLYTGKTKIPGRTGEST